MDLTCHWDRNPARLQVPSTKTTSGLAVEVEGQRLWLSGGKKVSIVVIILGNSRSQQRCNKSGSGWTY